MWDIKHKSGTLLFTTSDKSVADNRRTMGWVVEMKKLTLEKAQELIEQLSQGERSCREEYYLQALEAFTGCQWIACSDRMPDEEGGSGWILVHLSNGSIEMALYDCLDRFTDGDCYSFAYPVTHWRPLPGAPL